MASFEQAKYCPSCKRNVSATKDDRCKICGNKIQRGTWSVRFRIEEYDGVKNKRLSGYRTKKEAQEAWNNYIIEYKEKTNSNQQLTFLSLYNEYENYIKNRNKLSTHYDFVSKTKRYILPYFEKYKVKDIKPKIILEWQNSLNEYSYNYKCHLRNCLSAMLSYAEKYYGLPNKVKLVDNFRNQEIKQEMQIWTPEQFFSAMKYVKDNVYRTFYYALYLTGARKGEILATTWKDWNLSQGTLNINKSVTKKVTGSSWAVTTPKNQSSNRKIMLPKLLVDVMKQHKEFCKNEHIQGDFVFFGEAPLPETCICRYLNNAALQANIHKIRVHDLRHSHVSYLISQGVSIVTIAKRLGHSSIEQTLNTYSHMMPNEEQELIKKLNTGIALVQNTVC